MNTEFNQTNFEEVNGQLNVLEEDTLVFPVSWAQARLWFLIQLEPENTAYNQNGAIAISGKLNVRALEQSFNEIVRRHEALRTNFTTVKGEPVQVIVPQLTINLPIIDLQHIPQNEQKAEFEKIAREKLQQPFDLARDRLLRIYLLQLAPEEYVLPISMHHTIGDGWSLGVFLREIAILYKAFSTGEPSPLPDLPIQYADFTIWQREILQGQTLDNLLAYWKQQLNKPSVLDLPIRKRSTMQSFRGATESLIIPKTLSEALKNLSKEENASLFMTLLAAYNILLYRYSQQEDIIVGSPIANRTEKETEDLIGCFVNTLALRTELGGNPSFRELLSRVREVTLAAYTHQSLPFAKLVEALQPERDLSSQPLFQTMFVLQNAPLPLLELPGLTLKPLEVEIETAQFELVLSLQEIQPGEVGILEYNAGSVAGSVEKIESGMIGTFQYNMDVFDASTIKRMAKHFQILLEGIVANPDTPIASLPLLSPEEREQLLFEWNDTDQKGYASKSIHQLFEEQVEQTPDAVAVVFESEQITYAQLNARANQLAHYLQALGVGPEVLVGICLERSLDMVVGLLGILKAGGAYVPIDPDYPAERIAYMLSNSQVRVLLTQQGLLEGLPHGEFEIISLDEESSSTRIAGESQENPANNIGPDNLMYVIYTSGSTGKPKGVMNAHIGVANRLLWMQDTYQLTESDRVLQKTPFSFDVSVWEFFWPLLTGARLVVAKPGGHKDSIYLSNLIAKEQITTMHFVPPMLRAFLEQPQLGHCSCLKRVICSGEALPAALEKRFFERLSCELHNLYGPTEAAIDVTFWQCQPESQLGIVPIGRPVANTQIYILDSNLKPVTIGVPGELHIGGVQVARGYLGRPELTDSKFIADPFSNEPGARLYKTGDLARYLPDGNIEYIGRIDNQVKIRGFRIELGEIEAALLSHQQVSSTVVIAREDQPGNKRLVAYIVPEETTPEPAALRQFLKESLPEYMVPAAFVMLETMPLTANGKVDRRALPAPVGNLLLREGSFVLPQTPIEQTLAEIWQEILGVERVGVNDNFFTIGGDSILSIQVVSRAREAGIYITPKQLFEYQTIGELAANASSEPPIQAQQGVVSGEVVLTPIQQYFFEQQRSQPHHFNQSVLLVVPCDLDLQLLGSALDQLLVHHDALRLRFVRETSGWQQFHAGPEEAASIERVDLSGISPGKREAEIERIAAASQASLDLAEGPLMRAVLFDLGSEVGEARLLIIIHHLAVDGVSWRILLADLFNVYQQLVRGESVKLLPKTTAFQDWALNLRDYSQSVALQSQLEYWLNQPWEQVVPLPVDKPADSSDNTVASRTVVSVSLSESQTQALLQQVPTAYNTQINDVLLTVLAQSLASWQGTSTVLIDLEGHGREDIFAGIDITRTVGWFTSIFPVILSLGPLSSNGSASPAAAIKAIKEQLRAIPQAGFGYGVLRYLQSDEEVRAQLENLPKSEVVFNYLGQFALQDLQASGWQSAKNQITGSNHSPADRERHLLSIDAIVVGGKLQVNWSYSNKIHNPGTIERLAQEYIASLEALIEHCISPEAGGYTPSDFPEANLSQQELDQLAASVSHQAIEAIYPLSPMQEGMLFHTLLEPNSGTYVEQMLLTIEQPLNIEAFKQAWQQLLQNHAVLRTKFLWEQHQQPLQMVIEQVSLPWQDYNWQNLSEEERQQSLENLLQSDLHQGFDLQQAPLMRCTLIELGQERYQFLWSYHHILIDGWCLPILFKEVLQLYDALNRGEIISPSQEHPYQNYIRWLRQQDWTVAKAFWQQTLASFDTPTPLVVDRPVGINATQHSIYKEQNLQLSASVTEQLQVLSLRHRLTAATLIQAAWALLLSRYSNESEVVFGVVVSGRPAVLPGIDQMVGLFVNTLPLRISVPTEMPLLSWLQQVQKAQMAIQEYAYSPLVEIQKLTDVLAGTKLFESILAFENYPIDEQLRQSDNFLNVTGFQLHEQTNYPLSVQVMPGIELELRIIYESDRFASDIIARMLGHLQNLLEAFVANPEQLVSELPLLTSAERQQLLVDWNNTATDFESDKSIHQLFSEQVERTPDAVAVVFESEQITYRDLNARANQLAHYLQSLGVGPEVLVGICLERSIEMVVGLLGILKAGGAYVPLDSNYPSERLAYMLADTAVSVLLTQRSLATLLPEHPRVVCLDSDWSSIAEFSTEALTSVVKPSNLAYVIYTSGSTGKPKGVAMSQRALVNMIMWQQQEAIVGQGARTLQFAPISFDLSFQEIFSTWCSGGTLVLVSEEVRRDSFALIQFLAQNEIDRLFLPFVAFYQLARVARVCQTLPQLREIVTVGEQLQVTPDIVELINRLPNCTLQNQYGPSESHVVSAYTLQGLAASWPTLPPIGRPIANSQLYILSDDLKPVPIGVPGELYIGGFAIANGYFNRPELTAEKFITNPFGDRQEDRLYKTGDLARYLPDGNIEYIGRIDNQVKIRGFRIELGEIETVLNQHQAVGQAVVIAREWQARDKRLVAYIVSEAQETPTIAELRKCVALELPEYMVPSAFVFLETMPLTPNGKVDRRALPAPDASRNNIEVGFVAPRTPSEEILASIWADILDVEVGIYDNFFELGGHSLLATQAISRIRDSFTIELPLRSLFEEPTVAGLAELVEAASQEDQSDRLPEMQPVSREQELPLSFAQERLWFMDYLYRGNAAYNMPAALRLSGKLDSAALEQSIQEIARRHEVLRTTFEMADGRPIQKISPDPNFAWSIVDLQSLPSEERDAEVKRMAQGVAQTPFDLEKGPLLRLTLLILESGEQGEYVLLFTMHHIISDAWSAGVIVRELAALYEAFARGESSPLPELAIQYADFAHWQRQNETLLAEQLAYWQKQLAGSPPVVTLPTDRPRPEVQSFRGASTTFKLSHDLQQNIQKLCQSESVTSFMTLLTAFQTLLYCYSSESDIVVGSPIANRNRSETEELIGFFVNTLVMRGDLSGNPSFRELLRRSRALALGAYANQDLPFEKLVEELKPERSQSYNPIFQVWFVLQNAPMPPLELPGLTLTPLELDSGWVRHDLWLGLSEDSDGLNGSFQYKTDLFDAPTIASMAHNVKTILERVTADPDIRLDEIAKIIAGANQERQSIREEELEATMRRKFQRQKRKAIQM